MDDKQKYTISIIIWFAGCILIAIGLMYEPIFIVIGLIILFTGIGINANTKQGQEIAEANEKNSILKNSVGKCPHCGSLNTRKLSTTGKLVGTTLLGLASSSIGKQYVCNKCGHKW